MTPKHLSAEQWDDIKHRAKTQTCVRVAEDYGVNEASLRQMAGRKGIKFKRSNKRDALLPKRSELSASPQVRQALSQIARETGEGDPEKLIVALRDRLMEIADGVDANIVYGDKYEGMPNLGTTTSNSEFNAAIKRFAKQASADEFDLRDLISLLKDTSRLELERMGYHKAKMAAVRNTMDVTDPLAELLRELSPSLGPPSER